MRRDRIQTLTSFQTTIPMKQNLTPIQQFTAAVVDAVQAKVDAAPSPAAAITSWGVVVNLPGRGDVMIVPMFQPAPAGAKCRRGRRAAHAT